MKILIDNGHGSNTSGKRSPLTDDGNRIYEWEYTRNLAKSIVERLTQGGYDATLLTPENYDVSITARVRRANAYARKYGPKNVLLISIHLDAKGSDDKWHDAKGWSVRVAQNSSTNSKKLATLLYNQAKESKLKTRVPLPNQPYWVQNLGICRDTNCPAVLTENLFQDNKEDVGYLMTEEGFDTIVRIHVEAIKNYIHIT